MHAVRCVFGRKGQSNDLKLKLERDIYELSNGYLVDDTCKLEIAMKVLGIVDYKESGTWQLHDYKNIKRVQEHYITNKKVPDAAFYSNFIKY